MISHGDMEALAKARSKLVRIRLNLDNFLLEREEKSRQEMMERLHAVEKAKEKLE